MCTFLNHVGIIDISKMNKHQISERLISITIFPFALSSETKLMRVSREQKKIPTTANVFICLCWWLFSHCCCCSVVVKQWNILAQHEKISNDFIYASLLVFSSFQKCFFFLCVMWFGLAKDVTVVIRICVWYLVNFQCTHSTLNK